MSRAAVALLAVAAIVALVIGLLWPSAGGRSANATYPILASESPQPDGARALSLWLSSLGYDTRPLEYHAFKLSRDARVLFVLDPSLAPNDEQVAELVRWTRQGGRLVIVPGPATGWLAAFDVQVSSDGIPGGAVQVTQPLTDPAVTTLEIDEGAWLRPSSPDWVTLAESSRRRPVAATRPFGAGRVYLIASTGLFSNDGLRDPDSAAFALHLLDGLPPGSRVDFDEYHHGLTEYGSFWVQLVEQPWGWGIVLTMLACFGYLLLAGRRFGPALPALDERARRSRAEFATTLGGMLAAGDNREWLRSTYLRQVRQSLGTHFRVPADLPAAELVAELARQRPEASALAEPLARLEGPLPSQAALLRQLRGLDDEVWRLLGRSRRSVRHEPPEQEADD